MNKSRINDSVYLYVVPGILHEYMGYIILFQVLDDYVFAIKYFNE